jgi:hypothetical protein
MQKRLLMSSQIGHSPLAELYSLGSQLSGSCKGKTKVNMNQSDEPVDAREKLEFAVVIVNAEPSQIIKKARI